MKQLSKEEMKKVFGGGNPTVDTVYCNDGVTTFTAPGGDCTCGSAGVCNGYGGVNNCIGWGHPVKAQP